MLLWCDIYLSVQVKSVVGYSRCGVTSTWCSYLLAMGVTLTWVCRGEDCFGNSRCGMTLAWVCRWRMQQVTPGKGRCGPYQTSCGCGTYLSIQVTPAVGIHTWAWDLPECAGEACSRWHQVWAMTCCRCKCWLTHAVSAAPPRGTVVHPGHNLLVS